jgi:hypothetical protein
VVFIVSRCLYFLAGVRFDMQPLQFYWQIVDPVLLHDAFWQSLFYLRGQLPGFNFFVGAMIHLFPGHLTVAFHTIYLCLGLTFAICLFLLLDRMRIGKLLASVITIVLIVNPVTVLYENLLFYEYPLAVLFSVAALFLNRYVSHGRRSDGMILFTSLALIGLLRVTFHLLWFWLAVALVLYILPRWRLRTILCAAMPGALLSTIYIKNLMIFGLLAPGSDVYGAQSFANFVGTSVTPDTLQRLIASGAVSPILLYDSDFTNPSLVRLVALPPSTGIPILDKRLKSNGRINMDSLWVAALGRQLRRDGLVLLRSSPPAVLTTLWRNVRRYFLPADTDWPFDGRQSTRNQDVLARLLKLSDLLMAGKLPHSRHAFITYLTIPLVYCFGFRRLARWFKRGIRRPLGNARNVTIAFALGNIAYLTAVVLLFTYGDQNRYRFEVSALSTLLFGLWISAVVKTIGQSRATPFRALPEIPRYCPGSGRRTMRGGLADAGSERLL